MWGDAGWWVEKKWMIYHPKRGSQEHIIWWRHLNEIEQHVTRRLYALRASTQLMASGAYRSRACREYFIPWLPVGDNFRSHLFRHKTSMFICLLGLVFIYPVDFLPEGRTQKTVVKLTSTRDIASQHSVSFLFTAHTTKSKLFFGWFFSLALQRHRKAH